jgi:2',3'-cyclic-nucleotide 2'-phosphodiesterase (5'-nucleotidase family)
VKYSFYFLFLALLLEISCKTAYLKDFQATEIKINDSLSGQNQAVADFIKIYRDSIDKEMNIVIATNDHTASKAQPESELGNLLTDAMLEMSKKYTKEQIDLSVINYGGIRLPQLPSGDIKIGTVYELMPFDNIIVILTIDGKNLKALFDKMTEIGGWPISGATYNIKNGKAENIQLNGLPLDENKSYKLSISDYLANGGDKLDMLKSLPQFNTGILLRDAFIDYFKEQKKIFTKKDGRVTK